MSGHGPADVHAGASDQSEFDRLRMLVGPNEHSYDDLLTELAAAEQAMRDAEAANGVLRAQIVELTTSLQRAQQDQYHVLGLLARPRRLLNAIVRSAGPR